MITEYIKYVGRNVKLESISGNHIYDIFIRNLLVANGKPNSNSLKKRKLIDSLI
jgi:hypothetical protein